MKFLETSSTRPYYRRKLFLSTLVIVLLGSLCIAAGLFALFPSALGSRYGAAITALHAIDQMLVPTVAALFAVMTGLLALAVASLHLFYSHRVAGPAFRLGREAARIGGGDLRADFQLRSKDNLTDLAETLKEAAGRYRDTVNALDRLTSELDAQAASLAETARRSGTAELETAVRELASSAAAIDKMLSEIRT